MLKLLITNPITRSKLTPEKIKSEIEKVDVEIKELYLNYSAFNGLYIHIFCDPKRKAKTESKIYIVDRTTKNLPDDLYDIVASCIIDAKHFIVSVKSTPTQQKTRGRPRKNGR